MKKTILTLKIIIFIISCQNEIDSNIPPEIQYGVDVCDECSMIISEERFSSAYITKEGIRRFDDIGDMLLYNDEHQEDVLTFWVRDYKNEKWVGSDLANLVINGDITTPMMHGIIALEDPDQAKNLAIEINGKVISFDELLEHHNSMDHEHHD